MCGEVYGPAESSPRAEIVRRALPTNAAGRAGDPLGRAQAGLCHAGDAPYRCFLPDLTRFGTPAAQEPGSSERAVVVAGWTTGRWAKGFRAERGGPSPRGRGEGPSTPHGRRSDIRGAGRRR